MKVAFNGFGSSSVVKVLRSEGRCHRLALFHHDSTSRSWMITGGLLSKSDSEVDQFVELVLGLEFKDHHQLVHSLGKATVLGWAAVLQRLELVEPFGIDENRVTRVDGCPQCVFQYRRRYG